MDNMDAKKWGVIALAVVAAVILIWSLRSSFFGGPAPKGTGADAEAGKARMMNMMKGGSGGGPQRSGPPMGH